VQARRDWEERLEQSLRSLSYEATAQSQEAVARAVAPCTTPSGGTSSASPTWSTSGWTRMRSCASRCGRWARSPASCVPRPGSWWPALRAPQVRGRWGEHQLRRIVEAAGLLEHCDFAEQVTAATDNQGVRPDMVVRLHGGGPSWWTPRRPSTRTCRPWSPATSATATPTSTSTPGTCAGTSTRWPRRPYWTAFDCTPDFVVLFVPADPFLDAALQRDPALMEHALARNVVLATPATLIAMLRTVGSRLAAGGAGPQRRRPCTGLARELLRPARHARRARRQARRVAVRAGDRVQPCGRARWSRGFWSARASWPRWGCPTTS
jgi:DNA recombination protein RmuC